MTTRERIQQAVADEGWQEFRKSLKSTSTATKLDSLQRYWGHWEHQRHNNRHWYSGHGGFGVDTEDCNTCIQVDNYLKALMRGGQLEPFLDLSYFVNVNRGRRWSKTMCSVHIEGLRRTISVIRK